MKKVFLLLCLITGTASVFAQQKVTKDDLEELKNRMEGNFDSEEQSKADNSYYNIVLHMRQIWPTKKNKDGYWLYVEQALATAQDKPYRQRIYHLYKKDNETLVSQVYEMNDPMRFTGAWNNLKKLKKLSQDSLIERGGCAIYIKKDEDGNFYGSTPGKGCESSLKGATYATSEVTIYTNMLISWDRGWDVNDKQVWGAEKSGYRFRKFTLRREE